MGPGTNGGNSAVPAQPRGPLRNPGTLRPAVLFFDQAGYEQFDQIACCLRRRGIAAIKATLRPNGAGGPSPQSFTRWLRDQLFYDRCIRLDTAEEVGEVENRALRGFRLLDVLLAEPVVARLGFDHPMLEALGKRSLAFMKHPPSQLLDKFEVNARLEAAGVRVPLQCPADQMTPQQAVRAFGLPLVVKARIGLGGDGVRIAQSLADVESALRDLCEGDLHRCFFQTYVEGAAVGYACVRGPEGPLLDFGYRVDATQWSLGPSARVAMDGDASMVAIGRRVLEAIGSLGFAQIDMIRDAAGQIWPIDANLRPSGNIMSFVCLNVDFADAYLCLLQGHGRRRLKSAEPSGLDAAAVFPFALYDGAKRETSGRFADLMDQFRLICRHGPGWRYQLFVNAKVFILSLGRRRRDPGVAPTWTVAETGPTGPME
jgi:hypothetical protein